MNVGEMGRGEREGGRGNTLSPSLSLSIYTPLPLSLPLFHSFFKIEKE